MTKRKDPEAPAKRRNGDGSVYRRARGDWVASVTMPGGRRWTKSAATEDAAWLALAALQGKLSNDVAPGDDRMRLAAYLDQWLAQKRRISATTRMGYAVALGRATSVLGNVAIGKLAPLHIRQLHRSMEGADPPYAAASMNLTHTVLSMALADAVKMGVLTRNVAALVTRPAIPSTTVQALDGAQAARFIAAARGQRFEALFVLAITTGMRLGEILALSWADVDFEARTVRVVASSKRVAGEGLVIGATKRPWSRRLIPLPDVALEALRRRKAAAAAEQLKARAYVDQGLVFATASGRPTGHNDIEQQRLPVVLKAAGLLAADPVTGKPVPLITFHGLRHTCATLLLLDGVPAKVVADLLGHKSVAITLDRYSHVLKELRGVASDAMNRRFSRPVADSVAVLGPDEAGI